LNRIIGLLLILICSQTNLKSQHNILALFDDSSGTFKFKDKILLSELYRDDLPKLDTFLIIENGLFAPDTNQEFPITNYREADCRIVAAFKGKEYHLLALFYYTLLAGDGQPVVQIITLSLTGEIMDKQRINVLYSHDPEYVPTQYLLFKTSNRFELITNEKTAVLTDTALTETGNTTTREVFVIRDGIIKKRKPVVTNHCSACGIFL